MKLFFSWDVRLPIELNAEGTHKTILAIQIHLFKSIIRQYEWKQGKHVQLVCPVHVRYARSLAVLLVYHNNINLICSFNLITLSECPQQAT